METSELTKIPDTQTDPSILGRFLSVFSQQGSIGDSDIERVDYLYDIIETLLIAGEKIQPLTLFPDLNLILNELRKKDANITMQNLQDAFKKACAEGLVRPVQNQPTSYLVAF